MADLQRLQLASILAPGLTRRDLRLASVTAPDGTALFVAANRKRTSFWVEGTGHDGIRRHFQLVTQRVGPTPKRNRFPFVLAKWSVYENGRRIFRFSVSFAAHQRLLGLAAASFRPDGAAATKWLQLMCDGSASLSDGIILMRGAQHGTSLRGPLEATINLGASGILQAETPFGRWMEEAFHEELPRLQHFRPLLEYAAEKYRARWSRWLGLRGLDLDSPPQEILFSEDISGPKAPAECSKSPSTVFVAGCCDYQPTVGTGILCYAATAEAAVIDPLINELSDLVYGDDSGTGETPDPGDSGDDTADDGGTDGFPGDTGDDDPGSGEDWGGDDPSSGDEPGSPGGGCFVSGTRTFTAAGPAALEAIRPGDGIWSYDVATRRRAVRRVLRAYEHRGRKFLTLDFGDETICCTPPHRFYTGVWTAAATLAPGQRILTRDGEWRTLQRVTRSLHPQPVFNLLVEGLHNYFVGASGFLVHNEKDTRISDPEEPGWPDDAD